MSDNHYDYEAASIRSQTAQEQADFNLFSMLKPTIQVDGNKWCVLYGKDLQTGVSGFGDTPALAVIDFNQQWYKSLPTKLKNETGTGE